ncbi:NAD(P)-dependent dehydrogenase (short-subunit alcohol dehydrogenase family) [Natronospira proteinivora]|uniref:NAD(P)-dependent dehydrogenase (Short-subunit alcohol dehydrogenase family) n=1 Tax=Natronospira proteinivora TaxID=1807133 RepID=A0ABT1GAK3_9GAMM|nr:SDR family oxidoreductase [Natronospira proteinivora]MCP1728082.1 NAD(P)-dependent dehydrogenase (short-subunit alcohol dehydrogenase family) [Natronospira proteinivora]
MNTTFEGYRVLVTGANRGIGLACARGFAQGGATVGLHYASDREAAESALLDLPGDSHQLFQARLDEVADCQRLADEVETTLGPLDVLVNNAGVFRHKPVSEMDFTEWQKIWDETLALNLSGPAHLSFLLGKTMAASGQGRIINISSRGAFRGEPEAPAYGASKAGLNALTQSLAQALGGDGVSVSGVAPGFVETDMTRDLLNSLTGDAIRAQSPLGRTARPSDVAAAVLWLASPGAEFATGTIIDVNGASHLRQ